MQQSHKKNQFCLEIPYAAHEPPPIAQFTIMLRFDQLKIKGKCLKSMPPNLLKITGNGIFSSLIKSFLTTIKCKACLLRLESSSIYTNLQKRWMKRTAETTVLSLYQVY